MTTTSTTLIEQTAAWTDTDRRLMSRALELAASGTGLVSPGPLVGCVIIDGNGAVAGEGYYVFEDIKHAETLALDMAGDRARGGTAYVSLEPHAHHGRTSPCTDALIAAGIRRVVAPIEDLNPKVSGKGFEHLRNAGIEVHVGLLAEEAARLNETYMHFMRTGRPFVHLKLAMSLDGKIATRTGDARWITGPESRARAHELRHKYDAILVGIGTARNDDPLLTDRSGLTRHRPLIRVLLDGGAQLPASSQLATTARETPVLLFAREQAATENVGKLQEQGVEVVRGPKRDLKSILEQLGSRSIQSVLVEGGAEVSGSLVDAGLVNKVTFFIAPKIVGGSTAPSAVGGIGIERMSEAFQLENVEVSHHGDDIEVTGYPRSGKE